jgi:nucleoside-diphosphate-sugar epimerase
LRYFTVYGPRQRPDMAFRRFIHWALADEPIQVYGDGEQTRDFTFVDDIVAANLAAGESSAAGMAFNIGGGSRVSVNEVLRLIGELIGRSPRIAYAGTERGDVRHTSADTRLAARHLGYAPRVDLRSGLAAEVAWVRNLPATTGV